MPSAEFVEEVLAVVEQIPAGRVMTYGDVGLAIGSQAPRAVGRVMALYGHAVPWWRVVPASGMPPQGHASLALPHYLAEGTPLRWTGGGAIPGLGSGGRRAAAAQTTGVPASDAAASDALRRSPDHYRLALSAARLPYTHEIYAKIAL